MSSESFPCTQCGICCSLVGRILLTKDLQPNSVIREAIEEFPYKTDSAGCCEKYVDNKCSIYEDRPTMCNVAKMAELLDIPLEAYYKQSAKACNLLITSFGLDESFLIRDYDQP